MHPEHPGDITTAIEYGKQVAAKAEQQQREEVQRGNGAKGSGKQSVSPTPQGPAQADGGTRDGGSAPAGDATMSSIVDGGQVSPEAPADAGTTTVPTPGEGSGAGIPVPGGGSEAPITDSPPGRAPTDDRKRGNAGGASPFETIAGTASCLYLGAPPQLCMKAIEIINKLFGGLFGGDTSTRNEEISKLMGTLGEFAGVTGDFAKFDPSTFEKRFAEFGFRDPREGLDAFMKLLQGLEKEPALGLDPGGVHRALKTAKSLQERYDEAASCVKQLGARATQLISAAGGGENLQDTLKVLVLELARCPFPLEIVTPEQRSRHLQELQLLQGQDPVNCALAIAAARSGIAADKLVQANLLTADHCPVIQALLDRVMPGH